MPRIMPPDSPLDFEKLVDELTRLLYGADEPTPEQLKNGVMLTLTHDQLRLLSGWKRFTFHFWISLMWWTEDSDIIIGYGHGDVILISSNSNHSPLEIYDEC